jgi:hypothetical protein
MRRPAVKRLLDRFAAMMTAAALAEEGEAEKARQVVEQAGKDGPAQPAAGGR